MEQSPPRERAIQPVAPAAQQSWSLLRSEQRSRLLRLEDLRTKSPVPHNVPGVLPMTRLSGGRDGIDAITPEDFVGYDHGPEMDARERVHAT